MIKLTLSGIEYILPMKMWIGLGNSNGVMSYNINYINNMNFGAMLPLRYECLGKYNYAKGANLATYIYLLMYFKRGWLGHF